MLSTINQAQRDKYSIIPLIQVPRIGKYIRGGKSNRGYQGGGGRNGKLLFNECRVWDDEKVLKIVVIVT